MYSFLREHAIANVWCSPYQDRQYTFKAARLTSPTGIRRRIRIMYRDYGLPDTGSLWHVYQIGQLHPAIMGLLDIQSAWVSFNYVVNQSNMIIDLYGERGNHLPLTHGYIQVTANRNVIVAIRKDARFDVDFMGESLFFRFYTNAFYGSVRSDDYPYATYANGMNVGSVSDKTAMAQQYATYAAMPGHTNAFINGRLVDALTVANMAIGDYAELVWDGSVKRIVDIPIPDCPTFLSELDNTRKYILHYGGVDVDTIEYFDDVDIYLVKKDALGHFTGIYYHRNLRSAVRMLTHRDYAIRIDHVQALVDGLGDGTLIEDMTVRMIIRRAGFKRPLVDENSRIKELYKLSDEDLIAALTGTLSTLAEWSAPKLETAGYVELMRAKQTEVTQALIDRAYGYNAISKLVADSPIKVVDFSGTKGVDLSFSLQFGATLCEYGADGYLLGIYNHPSGTRYYCQNADATLVEAYIGERRDRFDEYRDTHNNGTPFTIDPFYGWRFYTCPDDGVGNPTEAWVDVTDDPSVVVVNTANEVVWSINPNLTHTLIVSDRYNVVNLITPQTDRVDDTLFFQLTSIQSDGVDEAPINLVFPKGTVYLWMNGKALIEGIDYKIEWPNVMVYNKRYRHQTGIDVDVIYAFISGHPSAALEREQDQDSGFVKWGLLSRNSIYDIRDDKVSRITVGGAVVHRDDLLFSEADSGVAVDESLNGMPYAIDDVIVPLHEVTVSTMRSMRAVSKDLDRRISNYMTPLLPEPEKTLPTTTPILHRLYSPFFLIVTRMMLGEYIDRAKVESTYTEMELQSWLADYEWALAYDPAYQGIDEQYQYVHPHAYNFKVSVNIYQYQFLDRVNAVYFNGRLDMATHYQVVPYESGTNLTVLALDTYLGAFE